MTAVPGLYNSTTAVNSTLVTSLVTSVVTSAVTSTTAGAAATTPTADVTWGVPAAAAAAMLAVVWLAALLGNLLVVVVIRRSRRLQSTTNDFLVGLAAADLVHGAAVAPSALAWVLGAGAGGAALCKVVRWVAFWLPGVTLLLLAAVCVDRYYTVLYPLSFKVTRSRAKQLIAASWLLAALLAAPALALFSHSTRGCQLLLTAAGAGTPWAPVTYLWLYVLLGLLLPLLALVAGYSRVVLFVWTAAPGGRRIQRTQNPVPRAKVKTVKMILVLNAATVVLVAPFFIIQLWYVSTPSPSPPESAVFALVTWLYAASAAAKPAVYTAYNSNFRRGCKEVFCMSTMKCYRSNAYTITTSSTLAKKNHVGVGDPAAGGCGGFDRTLMIQTSTWPLNNHNTYV